MQVVQVLQVVQVMFQHRAHGIEHRAQNSMLRAKSAEQRA
jgi:hypothetical protein